MAKKVVKTVSIPASEAEKARCESLVQMAEMNSAAMNGQRIITIPVDLLAIDHEYQREIAGSRWNKIVDMGARFNVAKAGLVLVSYRPDTARFFVIDGQGRYEAALKAGLKSIMCQILTNCSIKDEAELFLSQDENVTRVSIHAKVKAGIVAEHDDCLKLREIMTKYGVNAQTVSSIGAALDIAGSDPAALDWIFSTIYRAGWHEMDNGFSQGVIKSLNELYKREVCTGSPTACKRVETVLIPIMRENSPNIFRSVADLLCNRAKAKYVNMYAIMSGICANNKAFFEQLRNCQVVIPAGVA